jgi:hypothetical protein
MRSETPTKTITDLLVETDLPEDLAFEINRELSTLSSIMRVNRQLDELAGIYYAKGKKTKTSWARNKLSSLRTLILPNSPSARIRRASSLFERTQVNAAKIEKNYTSRPYSIRSAEAKLFSLGFTYRAHDALLSLTKGRSLTLKKLASMSLAKWHLKQNTKRDAVKALQHLLEVATIERDEDRLLEVAAAELEAYKIVGLETLYRKAKDQTIDKRSDDGLYLLDPKYLKRSYPMRSKDLQDLTKTTLQLSAAKAGRKTKRKVKKYDVIIASDFRLPGGTSNSNAEEIKAQHQAGLSTGLVQMPIYDLDYRRELNPKIVKII